MFYVRFTPESGHLGRGRCTSAYDPKRTLVGLCDLAATYSYAAFKYRYRSVHFLSLSMPDYLVGVTCAISEPSRSLVPVYSSFALRTLSLADVFRQEKFAAPETFTEFALVLAIRFGFKLGAICHVLDRQIYPRRASSMSGSIAALSVVTWISVPWAFAMDL